MPAHSAQTHQLGSCRNGWSVCRSAAGGVLVVCTAGGVCASKGGSGGESSTQDVIVVEVGYPPFHACVKSSKFRCCLQGCKGFVC